MRRRIFSVAWLFLFGLCFHLEAYPGLAETLKKIDRAGVITIGYSEFSVPFSYLDDHNRVIGYSHDLVMEVVEAIKMRLSRPALAVKLIPVTEQNRVSLIQNGTVDIEVGPTVNSPQERQATCFSNAMFVVRTCMLVHKNSEIHGFPDLVAKNVIVSEATPALAWIQGMNESKGMSMNILTAKDDTESFSALESGRVVAFVSDEVRLAYARAKAVNPDDWAIVGVPELKESYSMVLPNGDREFKELVDVSIARSQMFGKADRLYKRWFQSPIPPKRLNLELSMSDDLRWLFRNPNDQALLPRQNPN